MKITVTGLERRKGTAKATGKPYEMGAVHALVKLDESSGEGFLIKGAMGTTYDRLPIELIQRIEHLPLPFEADLTVEDVMRFGKREAKVIDIRPLSIDASTGELRPMQRPVAKAA